MAKIYGRAIGTAGGAVPSIFGDGSDGDLIVRSGETKTLEVPVPHQSIVEMQYNSILIEAGGTLNCSDPNAGLVLRCKGDCTIQGTIDQTAKSPKTNPNNSYIYPEELKCGDGGDGGSGGKTAGGSIYVHGGKGMAGRPYGGGWSGGGAGVSGQADTGMYGADGGSVDNVTVDVADSALFVGGAGGHWDPSTSAVDGANGGGGGGGHARGGGSYASGGRGASGPGQKGSAGSKSTNARGGPGGGSGNLGGGVLLLYIGGTLSLEGTIACNGGNGGDGGGDDPGSAVQNSQGIGGGGAGGGAIYIVHNASITNTASLQVNGGTAGASNRHSNYCSVQPTAGTIGTVTIKQYEKGMTA